MGELLYRIAQASRNENESGLNGSPGDQTGEELNAVKYYNYPWNVLIRAKDPVIAEKIADSMEKLVSNGYIGYDYNTTKRCTLFNALNEIDFDIDLLNKSCFADCSSTVYCAVYSATKIPFTPVADDNGLQYAPKCSMLDNYLMNDCAGMFEYIENDFSTCAGLKRGDILVKTVDPDDSNHTGVWI